MSMLDVEIFALDINKKGDYGALTALTPIALSKENSVDKRQSRMTSSKKRRTGGSETSNT